MKSKEFNEQGDYHSYNYLEVSESFDKYFTQDKFMTSRKGAERIRYEVTMAEIDFWINIQNLGISNDFRKDGQRFKKGLFYHLRKIGWQSTQIKGRWKKLIRNIFQKKEMYLSGVMRSISV